LDTNYRCIARGILKNKSQIEIPDKAENRTGLRTEQDRWNGDQEAKQTQIGRKGRPRIITLKRDCYQVWRASLLATQV